MNQTQVRHPLFARLYSRVLAPAFAKQGGDDLRRRLLAGLEGTVVEVGAGDGANFAHYPDEVTRIVAVEPEAYLREQAAAHTDERIELRNALATGCPCATARPTPWSSAWCSARSPTRPQRWPRPGGCCVPGASCASSSTCAHHEPGFSRRAQRVLDATVWPRLFGGCHISRDTVAAIEEAGFTFTELERFSFPEGARGPSSPAVLGRAVPRESAG